MGISNPTSASGVDPASIQFRANVGSDAELLVRHRPPGQVDLPGGQCEHMLMSSIGSPVAGRNVRSTLQTPDGDLEWNDCPRGHVTFVPAGYPINWGWSYQSESIHLTLLPSFLEDVSETIGGPGGRQSKPLKPLLRIYDVKMNGLLRQLQAEASGNELGKDLMTSTLLMQVATRIHRLSDRSGHTTPSGRRSGAFTPVDQERCLELLNDRLDENIPLAELAQEFGLSPYHFSRLFKKALGLPPHEYQLQLRIDRARHLLRSQPDQTLASLACALGFTDESHFRRHFKRIVGMTPGHFRSRQ